MTAPIAEATVKAILDFADVDRDFARKLDQATKSASAVVSRNLTGVTKAAQGAAKDVEDAGGRMTRAAKLGEQAGTIIGKGATGFLNLGDAALGAVGKLAKFSGIGAAVTGTVSGLAAGFSVLTLGFGRLQSIEQAEAKLTGLGHSAESVAGIMDSALASVKGTAFGLGDAATVAASAVAAGIKPGEDLTRTLKLIGDAATIGGTSMGDMGAIFNKVATSGKVQGEVLAQLGDRGIPIIQLLADEMGVAASEVADLGSEGKISFDTFRNAIEKGMGGAALAAGQTFSGAVNNAKAAMGRLGAEILQGPFNAAPRIIGYATAGIDALTNKVKGVSLLLQSGDYTADIGKLLGVSEDSAVVDRILSIREAALKLYEGAQLLFTGDFTGGFAAAFGVGADSPLVSKILGLRDLFIGWGDQIGRIFNSLKDTFFALGPPLADIMASFGQATASVGISTWSLLLDVIELLAPVIGNILVVALTLVANLMRENQGLVTGLVAAYTTYKGVVLAARAAQILLNIAMAANPIGLIVVAIAALVGALVYFFTQTETGKRIWNAVWNGIKDVVSAVWDWLQGVWDKILVGFRAIGDAAMWLWHNAIEPAWNGIQAAASVAWTILQGIFLAFKIAFAIVATAALLFWEGLKVIWDLIAAAAVFLWENVLSPTWDAIKAGFQILGDFFGWVWDTLIKPAWDTLGAGIDWVWQNVILPVWDAIKAGLQAVGDFFGWVWNNIIKPAWDTLGAGIDLVWNTIISPVWENFKNGLRAIGDLFVWVWDNVIKPAWDALGAGLKWVNDNVIQPVWEGIKTGLGAVRTAFDEAVKFIGQVWDTIKAIVAKPIAFIIQSVYNDGIRSAWNRVAGWLNLKELDEYKPAWLAQYMQTGGRVGSRNGPRGDRVPIMGEAGEFMLRRSAAQAIGYDNLERFNRNPITAHGKRLGEGMFVGMQSGGIVNADRFLTGEHGKPYQYGGVGDPSWDCSGLWSGIVHALHNENPRSGRLFSTESDFPSMGWKEGLAGRVTIGIMRGGGGPNSHMAGTIAGRNAEASGDNGVQWGGAARGADNPMFDLHYFLPEEGGEFVSGGAGGGGIVRWLRNRVADVFDAIMTPIGAAIPSFGDSVVGNLPKTVFDYMRDKVRAFLVGEADKNDTGGAATPGTGPVWDQIRDAFASYGWGDGPQWDAAKWIANKESGGNPNARNPTSGAYGIGQFLGHENDKYGAMGAYSNNPRQQAAAMAEYIKDRYGDPLGAQRFWQANGWYDSGGVATGSGILLKDVIRPERVLDPDVTVLFERFVNLLELFANGRIPAPAQTAPSGDGTGGTGGKVYPAGIAGANQWATDQDFGSQFRDWGVGAAKEITGQFTSPFGLESLSDRAIDDLKTAAEALAAARQQQGAQVTVNVNGAGNPTDVGAAVVDQIEERMAPASVRYRNGG